jgi:lipopolysaccharide exporter
LSKPLIDQPVSATNRLPDATGSQIVKGVGWMVLFKLSERSVGFISTLILARLLVPNDFGLIAMGSAVAAGVGLMGAFGFDSALIQRQTVARSHYDTAWTYNVVFGIGVALLIVAVSEPATRFYREPRLGPVLYVLALAALVQGFENVGTVQFRKELNFGKEFRFLFAKRVTTFIVTIALAVALRNYWALVAGMLTSAVCGVAISYLAHDFRPRFTFSAQGHLFHFSKWLFLSNFIQFLRGKTSDFILGRTVGTHGLGIYSIAMEIASLPSTELIAPLNRAMFPAYSRLAEKPVALNAMFIDVYAVIAVVAFPAAVGLACVAGPAVLVLLGEKWVDATPVLQILTVAGLVGALQSNLYLVIVSMGHPKVNTVVSAALLLVYLPACVVASLKFGIVGVAWTYLIVSLMELVAIHIAFLRVTRMAASRLLATIWRPLVAATIMAAGLLAFRLVVMAERAPLETVVAMVIIGAVMYVAVLLVIWWLCHRPNGAESFIVNWLRCRARDAGEHARKH